MPTERLVPTDPPRRLARTRPRFGGGVAALTLALLLASPRPSAPAEPAAGPGSDPAVVSSLEAGMTPEQRAELRFLEHLGWRFVRGAGAKQPTVHAGTPCYRKDMAAAWAGGDLRVELPEAMGPKEVAAFGATLSALADGIGSRCAWKHKIAIATRTATAKLAELADRGLYTFPKVLIFHSPVFRCTLPQPEWKKVGVENLCTGSPARAIEAIYARGGVAECYTGQWIAIFATQYELYGPAWFDEVFQKEELRLGRPMEATQTTLGRYVDETKPFQWRSLLLTQEDMARDPGLVLAEHGPKAFAGLTGILQNETEAPSANQNLTFVSVTPRAVEELKAHGGFRRVLELTREANPERKAGHRGTSESEREEHRQRYRAILADPVMSEVMVYVQPFGVVPLAQVAHKEMDEDGFPMKVRVYTNGLDDLLYQRYRTAWKARWTRGSEKPPGR